MKSRLDCFGDDRQIAFHVPNKMDIDLGIGTRRHGTKPAQSGLWSGVTRRPSRKTAGLTTLRENGMNAAEKNPLTSPNLTRASSNISQSIAYLRLPSSR